jgi:hypothetical protein
MIGTQKADTLFDDLQNAAAEDESIAFGFGLQQSEDEIGFLEARVAADALFFGDVAQIGKCFVF